MHSSTSSQTGSKLAPYWFHSFTVRGMGNFRTRCRQQKSARQQKQRAESSMLSRREVTDGVLRPPLEWAGGRSHPSAASSRFSAERGVSSRVSTGFPPGRAGWDGAGAHFPTLFGRVERQRFATLPAPPQGGVPDELQRHALEAIFVESAACGAKTVVVTPAVPRLEVPRHLDGISCLPNSTSLERWKL